MDYGEVRMEVRRSPILDGFGKISTRKVRGPGRRKRSCKVEPFEPVLSGIGNRGLGSRIEDGKDGLSQCLFSVQCLFSNPASQGPCLPRRLCARDKLSTLCSLHEMSHWIPARRVRSGSTDLTSTFSQRTWYEF